MFSNGESIIRSASAGSPIVQILFTSTSAAVGLARGCDCSVSTAQTDAMKTRCGSQSLLGTLGTGRTFRAGATRALGLRRAHLFCTLSRAGLAEVANTAQARGKIVSGSGQSGEGRCMLRPGWRWPEWVGSHRPPPDGALIEVVAGLRGRIQHQQFARRLPRRRWKSKPGHTLIVDVAGIASQKQPDSTIIEDVAGFAGPKSAPTTRKENVCGAHFLRGGSAARH